MTDSSRSAPRSEARTELGDFLRSRREKLQPEDVGLAAGRRRRAPGLRREEVAELAGIGIDWYIRLEQGRSVNPSPATIDALVRALRLGRAEHAHLKALTRSGEKPAFQRETPPGSLLHMIDAMRHPAYLTGRRWDLLAWNVASAEVFGFDRLAEADQNILILLLTRPESRKLFGARWAEEARRIVGQFRATHDLWADDPAFRELLARLRQDCPEFAGWWKAHDVRAAATGEKVLRHARLGTLRFEHASFQSNDDPAIKLVIYTPVPAK